MPRRKGRRGGVAMGEHRELIELGAKLVTELNKLKAGVEYGQKNPGRYISFTDLRENVREGHQLEEALEPRVSSTVSAMQRHVGTRPAFCLCGVLDEGRWLFVMARSMDILVMCACERIETSGKYGWTQWSYASHLDAERHRLMEGTPREILAQIVGMERWLALFKSFPGLHRDPDPEELTKLQKEIDTSIEAALRREVRSYLMYARAFGREF